jgi:hypothetical protein
MSSWNGFSGRRAGTDVFLGIAGSRTNGIRPFANDLGAVKVP